MKKYSFPYHDSLSFLLGLIGLFLVFAASCPARVLAGQAGTSSGKLQREYPPDKLQEVIRQIERKYLGESAEGLMTMQVATRHYTRKMRMQYWSKGKDLFLVTILYPAKDEGISTLKVGKDIWNYLPKVDRVIKIPPSMMGGSWMGSHITNDDLVKESQIADDYTFRLIEDRDGIWVIEALPKPEAAVVWGKMMYEIIMPDLVPRRISYFDEEGKEVRGMKYSDIQEIQGRKIPLSIEVTPLDKPNESTTLRYEKIHFGISLKDDFFSLRNLKKR
ncbi:MAG: outer membrane lipoprotein-sorting protein [bacterium]